MIDISKTSETDVLNYGAKDSLLFSDKRPRIAELGLFDLMIRSGDIESGG